MDLQDEHYEEVYSILFKNAIGLSFEDLYTKCKQFDEKTDLSRCLHRAGQQGNVRKLPSGLYRLTPEKYKEISGGQELPEEQKTWSVQEVKKSDAVTEEIRELLKKDPKTKEVMGKVDEPKPEPRVIRVAPKTETPKPAPVVEEKPFGSLQRTKALGGVALSLYRVRNDSNPFLTLSELSELTGCTNVVLSQRMAVLIDRKYVEKDVSDGVRRPKFKWAGNYRYPFDQWRKSDDELVRYTVSEWSNRKGTTKKAILVPPSEVQSNEPVAVGDRCEHVDLHHTSPSDQFPILSSLGVLYPGLAIDRCSNDDAKELLDLHVKAAEANLALLKHIQKCSTSIQA